MKHIELQHISITNFKGIAKAEFDFDGSTDITADVQQGKSTLRDAYLFALGVDIDNFYPLDKDNKYIEGLKTNVTIIVETNGLAFELSRSANIKYKTDKERDVKLFDGFKKDIFSFDQIPCTASKYKESVVELFGISDFSTLKVLSILNYFNEQMSWRERRQLLYELYVDKSQIKALSDNIKYALIHDELQKGKTSAEIATIINTESKRVQEEKTKNAILLESKKAELSGFAKINYDLIESDLLALELDIQKEKAKLEAGSVYSYKTRLNNQLSELNNKLSAAILSDSNKKSKLTTTVADNQVEFAKVKSQGALIEGEIRAKNEEFHQIQDLQFDNSKIICPTCHQKLPEELYDKIADEWINDKSAKLRAVTAQISSLKEKYANFCDRYSSAQAALKESEQELESFEPSKEIASIKSQIEEVTKMLAAAESTPVDTTNLELMETRRLALLEALGNRPALNMLKSKIASLEENQKTIINNEIMIAKKKKQLEDYTIDIINTINDSINSHFNGIRFKLFETLTVAAKKDIKETLIVLSNGVDYGACSTGQKAETNMLIISTLQKTFGVSLPIWVDDASITNFNYLPQNQMILLYNEKGAKLNCSKIRDIY